MAFRGQEANGAILLMEALVLPQPQGAVIRFKAPQRKQDVSSTSERNLPFFIQTKYLLFCFLFVVFYSIIPAGTFVYCGYWFELKCETLHS